MVYVLATPIFAEIVSVQENAQECGPSSDAKVCTAHLFDMFRHLSGLTSSTIVFITQELRRASSTLCVPLVDASIAPLGICV